MASSSTSSGASLSRARATASRCRSPSGEPLALLADVPVQPARQPLYEPGQMRLRYRPVQRSVIRLRIGEKQVVAHRVVEDVGVLGDDPDPGSQIFLGVAADVASTETDLTAIGVPETQDQARPACSCPSRSAPRRRPGCRAAEANDDILQRRRTVSLRSGSSPGRSASVTFLWQEQGFTRVRDLGARSR